VDKKLSLNQTEIDTLEYLIHQVITALNSTDEIDSLQIKIDITIDDISFNALLDVFKKLKEVNP
jgi:hypothetical protein